VDEKGQGCQLHLYPASGGLVPGCVCVCRWSGLVAMVDRTGFGDRVRWARWLGLLGPSGLGWMGF
jgi:hypothetical protein